MLVDLGRNDIGKISKIGSVKVEKYMCVEHFSHVMHLGSTVVGDLREDKDAVDAVDAILPAGTLSGAPKFRACQIIEELEHSKRGIYGGAIGYLDFTGNLDTCIAIRLVYKKKVKSVFVPVPVSWRTAYRRKNLKNAATRHGPWFRQLHRHRRDWNDSTD